MAVAVGGGSGRWARCGGGCGSVPLRGGRWVGCMGIICLRNDRSVFMGGFFLANSASWFRFTTWVLFGEFLFGECISRWLPTKE